MPKQKKMIEHVFILYNCQFWYTTTNLAVYDPTQPILHMQLHVIPHAEKRAAVHFDQLIGLQKHCTTSCNCTTWSGKTWRKHLLEMYGWSSLKGAVNVVMHKVSTTWVLTNSLKSLKTNTLVHWTRFILAKNVWLRRSWRAIFQRRHRAGKKRYNGALARLCLLRALVQCEILQMVHLDFFLSSSSS